MPRRSETSRQTSRDSLWSSSSAFSASWKLSSHSSRILCLHLMIVILLCRKEIEGFSQCQTIFTRRTTSITTESQHHRILSAFSSSRHGHYSTFPRHRQTLQSRTKLYEKPKSKQQQSSSNRNNKQPPPPARRESTFRSFVPSFFSSSDPEPPKQEEEEEKSGWRNFFRRNKQDDDDGKDKDIGKASKQKKKTTTTSSSSKSKSASRKIQQKQQVVKKPILSDKLRQQAAEEQKRSKKKPNGKPEDITTETDEASLWAKFSAWRKGNATADDEDANKSIMSNTTNPISAFQKYWQENTNRRDEEWVDVIPKTRLSPGEVVPVTVGGLDLLIIAGLTSDNRLYAIANRCPHLGTPLEIGQLVRLPKETATGTPDASSSSLDSKEEESAKNRWTELQVSSLLQQDGCEDCIVCPLHKTAFALESGQVRGEWCPYPPVVGKLTSLVKDPTPVATFDVRVRKKNIQIRLNSPLPADTKEKKKD